MSTEFGPATIPTLILASSEVLTPIAEVPYEPFEGVPTPEHLRSVRQGLAALDTASQRAVAQHLQLVHVPRAWADSPVEKMILESNPGRMVSLMFRDNLYLSKLLGANQTLANEYNAEKAPLLYQQSLVMACEASTAGGSSELDSQLLDPNLAMRLRTEITVFAPPPSFTSSLDPRLEGQPSVSLPSGEVLLAAGSSLFEYTYACLDRLGQGEGFNQPLHGATATLIAGNLFPDSHQILTTERRTHEATIASILRRLGLTTQDASHIMNGELGDGGTSEDFTEIVQHGKDIREQRLFNHLSARLGVDARTLFEGFSAGTPYGPAMVARFERLLEILPEDTATAPPIDTPDQQPHRRIDRRARGRIHQFVLEQANDDDQVFVDTLRAALRARRPQQTLLRGYF